MIADFKHVFAHRVMNVNTRLAKHGNGNGQPNKVCKVYMLLDILYIMVNYKERIKKKKKKKASVATKERSRKQILKKKLGARAALVRSLRCVICHAPTKIDIEKTVTIKCNTGVNK